MTQRRPRRAGSAARSGFTLLELMVSFFILIFVLLSVLAMFNLNSRLARSQTLQADMQQSLRVAQYTMMRQTRMAGRGGLPRGTLGGLLPGLAVAVRNDAPAAGPESTIAVGDADTPGVVVGSDVLTIRGVFSTPIYLVDPSAGTFVLDNPDNPTSGTVQVRALSPAGVNQDFEPILRILADGLPDALIMVSPVDDGIYAVVELDPGFCADGDCVAGDTMTLEFNVTGDVYTDGYTKLSPGGVFPTDSLKSVGYLGLLEEHRFYIREAYSVPDDESTELMPRLARAQFFPGTELPRGDTAASDLADNIVDLQVALGIDTEPEDGEILDDGTGDDEWLYNSADDDDTDFAKWDGPGPFKLYNVRITALARSDRPDFDHVAAAITGALEDHAYDEQDAPEDDANRRERMFRRWVLRTVVDLRNVS